MAKFTCSGCGFTYDEAVGMPREGYPAGTVWADIPEDFPCPDCAVCEKPEFDLQDD